MWEEEEEHREGRALEAASEQGTGVGGLGLRSGLTEAVTGGSEGQGGGRRCREGKQTP